MRTEIIGGPRRDGLPLPPPTPPTKSAGQVKKKELERQIFTTSRELEYFTESELTTQTGYPREQWWPGVVVKELVDNSLDACEQVGVAPVVNVNFRGQSVIVSDNGPGIASDVIAKVLDFSTRTSDKQAYVSPTRGAQGNALKTLLAIPYILSEGQTGTVEIESQGVRHTVAVSTDHVARRPHIEHAPEAIVKTEGTSILLALDSASTNGVPEDGQNLQKLVFDYALFNPHSALTLRQSGEEHHFSATTTSWRKWLPSDPTSAHWYNLERFENLVASYVAAESEGGRARTVREFVSEFRGLSSTVKQKKVTGRLDLSRAHLRDLVVGEGKLGRQVLSALLREMKAASKPVKPEALGVLGEDHFRQHLCKPDAGGDNTFRYNRAKGIDDGGLPFMAEVAFATTENALLRGLHIGLNWSVPLSNPIQHTVFALGDDHHYGLSALLAHNRIDIDRDPVCLVIHLICPRFNFTDRGKGNIALSESLADSLAGSVRRTTKEWAAIKKREERDQQSAARAREKYFSGRSLRTTTKEAAYDAMPEAYLKAGGGRYPVNARQLMYAARPAIQDATGQPLDDAYFTQTLLPDYIRGHREETADWDVVYDARGHLLEPHTETRVNLGTLGVREYLGGREEEPSLGVEPPTLSAQFPTHGPKNRFGAILYIEKEGFLPLLERAKFAERYDLAIMSSKGMGTTAVRKLIESLCHEVKILVLHDFDKSGFSIVGTLTRNTRRYEFAIAPKVVDLGLRLSDVEQWDLQSEMVSCKSDPEYNLSLNGATEEEIEFLRGEPDWQHNFRGQRVELNAFTSDAFVEWLESKLEEQGVAKVIPDDSTLEDAYRRARGIQLYRAAVSKAEKKIQEQVASIEIPKDLRDQLGRHMVERPSLPWDEVLEEILPL